MRLRNVKNKEEILNSSLMYIKDPIKYKDKWNEVFNNNEIHLEIGMGKGRFIKELARCNPNINYIGLEKSLSVLSYAIDKDEYLPNLRFICYNASKIDDLFDKEISKIYLNFSDPWPKKRHIKRRLTSPLFLEKYDKIFKDDKKITFKTDNRELFEYSLISFVDNNYHIENISLDLHNSSINDNILTEYEEKFCKCGYRIYLVSVYKK